MAAKVCSTVVEMTLKFSLPKPDTYEDTELRIFKP